MVSLVVTGPFSITIALCIRRGQPVYILSYEKLSVLFLIPFNYFQLSLANRRRKEEMATLMEAITTTEALKRKMEIDLKDIETKANNIVALENKLMIMKSQSEEGKLTVEIAETRFSDVPMLMELVR